MSSWLEEELRRDLARVRAPAALWSEVNRAPTSLQTSPTCPRRPLLGRPAFCWAAGAIAAAILAFFAMPAPSLSRLAAGELANARPPEFRSADPLQIADWLRKNAAVDVSIPQRTAAKIIGARAMERDGARIGEVLYRIAGRDALLLVARGQNLTAPARHGQSTWMAQGQVYALAYAATSESRLACQLCHVD